MYLRKSRLRSVVLRACCLFTVVFILFKFGTFINGDKAPLLLLNTNQPASSFWQQLSEQDRLLTDEQRIQRIESSANQLKAKEFNWTRIFNDIYQRKTDKLNERDAQSAFKSLSMHSPSLAQQKSFDIFEETPVRSFVPLLASLLHFPPSCAGLSTSEVLLVHAHLPSSMSVQQLSVELQDTGDQRRQPTSSERLPSC